MILAVPLSLLLAASDAGVLLDRPVSISAPHAELFNKESRGFYSGGVTVVRDTMTMTCDRLDVYGERGVTKRLLARGHVVAIDGDREARGDEAEFINETGVLTMRGNPRGKQGPREVDGEVITFTTGIDRLVVTKAHTRVREPKDKQVMIDADLLTFEGPKNEATWTGHVHAVKGKMTLIAPELTALSDESGEVTRVKARGGVEVTEDKRWARGQFADYDVPKGLLVVTGNPQARDGTTRMKGTRVTFFSGAEYLVVENAKTVIEVEKKKVR